MRMKGIRIDWKYAATELVVIVAGVLIALGVDSWRQGVQSRRAADDYRARVEEDLGVSLDEIRGATAMFRAARDHVNAIIPYVRDPRLPVTDSAGFVSTLYHTTRTAYPAVQSRTYEELKATGNLRLLSGDGRDIVAYYTDTDRFFGAWAHDLTPHRDLVRSIIPPDIQAQIRDECPTVGTPPLQCDADLDVERVAEVLRTVRGNEQVLRNLYLYSQQVDLWLGILDRVERRTRALSIQLSAD